MLSQIRCRWAVRSRGAGRRCRRRGQVEGDGHDVVVAGRVVAQVRGPAAGVGLVAAAAQQQALHQVVADPAGGRGDHPLAAEDDPADGGGVFGDQQAHVLAEDDVGRVDGDQVRRDLVPHEDGGHDDGGGAADVRQAERALAQPGRAEHLAEPGVDDVLPDRGRGLVGAHAGRGRGQHVHELGDDRDGGGHPVRDELHHPGQVGVLQGQAGQVAVYGDELAQRGVLAVEPVAVVAASVSGLSPGGDRTGDQSGSAMLAIIRLMARDAALWLTTNRGACLLSTCCNGSQASASLWLPQVEA